MPVYKNEAIGNIVKDIYDKIIVKFKEKDNSEVEFLIAQDGIGDKTRENLLSIKNQYSLTLNTSDKRRGYIGAVKEIFSQAKGEYIFFTDADGEHDPSDFWKLWENFNKKKLDIIVGYKQNRRPYYRLIISKINNLLMGIIFGLWLKDANCGFRILKSTVASKIIPLTGNLVAAYNAETMIWAKKMGYNIGEVGVRHMSQPSVVFSGSTMHITIVKALIELIKFRIKIGS